MSSGRIGTSACPPYHLALVIGGVVGVLVVTVTLWRFLAESVHNSTDALSLTGEGL